ncbi:MAG TPA: hypothetical protein VF176_05900 [Solirubrobacterales bacterium]
MAWLAASLLSLSSVAGAAVPGHERAWELVTSGDTNGVLLAGGRGWAPDGDRVAFATFGTLPGAPAGDLLQNAIATRTPQGWSTAPVGNAYSAPGANLLPYPTLLAMSSDLSTWDWVSLYPLLPGAPSDPTLAIYRQPLDGTLTLLGSAGEESDGFTFMDASADLEHAAFQTQAHLLPADAGRTQGSAAYEYAGSALRLVGVDDTGLPLSSCGSVIGNGNADPLRTANAVSRDGRRIFFSAPPACGQPNRVYVREDGAHTIEVSASSCDRLDCNAPQAVTFVGATPDGSQALLVTGQQLTDDDTDADLDLYRRDLPGGALTRLSAGPPGVTANVNVPVVRASDDGERVYFAATGELVPGSGVAGQRNLYLNDHGTLHFIATAGDIDLSRSEITPGGGSFVFTTASALLPSDLDSKTDVYRYDAASDTLAQVSLGVDGRGNEPLNANFDSETFFGGLVALPNELKRYLSDDGRVFFVTSEALLPEDHNQTVDVYERAGGTLGLVTSGMGETISYMGVSADGRSAFFNTYESLIPADRDDGDDDVYVARLGGGFPEPAPPPPACTGDACQGPPISGVDRPSPDTLTNAGGDPQGAPFGLRPLSARARQRLAATGRTRLLVDVPAAGHLSLVARARTAPPGKAEGLTVVGRADVTVRLPGVVRLPLRLSPAAVGILDARGSLLLTLSVRHSMLGAASPSRVRLIMKATRPHGRRIR